MKLYILDGNEIVKFELPEKVEEYFLIRHKFFKSIDESTITIAAENNKWYIKSNVNANIVSSNSIVQMEELSNYSQHHLKLLNLAEQITLYAMPSPDTEMSKFEIPKTNSISIGKGQDNYILYNGYDIAEHHATINMENNLWYISSIDNNLVYVNNSLVTQKRVLKLGDVIFINGLRIIWMNNFIKVNNPNRAVGVRALIPYQEPDTYDITNCNAVSEEENSIDLYSDDDYFYHIPRIRSTFNEDEIQIDPPPASALSEEVPVALTFGSSLAMAATSLISGYRVFSNVYGGKQTLQESLPALILCIATIFGSLIMPRITALYQKRKQQSKEKKRQTKYKEYLKSKEEEINGAIVREIGVLKENNPSTIECIDIIQRKTKMMWCREPVHDDFGRVRLGIGSIPSKVKVVAPEKKFTLDEDNLIELVYNVAEKVKILNDVPVTVSFVEKNIWSFICKCNYKNVYINNLILQLATLQSAQDLKLVIFTDEKQNYIWEYAKFLPHCWSDDKAVRLYATNSEEMKEVSSYLEQELKKRKEKDNPEEEKEERQVKKDELYKSVSPYYIIITDNYKSAKNTSIIDMILKSNSNYGFSLVAIGDSMKELPNKCDNFIELCDKDSCIISQDGDLQSQQVYVNEVEFNIDMHALSKALANIPIASKDGLSVLPQSLSFLDMYGISKIEQLNIYNRWKNSNPVTSLAVPVGVHADGEQFKLDLHEKFHGPHGLIAGSTGSGKSEFIITYILSMACNFHPYEVQFVLIDYKGGGLAGAFENKETGVRIPHLAGTITNLDTAEMNRTLVSIQSELKRRQRKFNEVKDQLGESTIDIYKYQRFYREGLIKEPMAHLFIISDEFAELKSQQPEFLQELVSTARIGRSLGVHLILATQKPSGVVNDQIWSNSKFKVCLKVQDRSDSMEMLKRPEAASIKEVGRFYLQVGYDDYFDIGQSGWGGAKYQPTDVIVRKTDDSISFVNNVGNVIKSVNEIVRTEKVNDIGDQLTNIVKYISNLSKKENIISKQLWLPSIPEYIYIENLKKKYNYKPTSYFINPVIGEYDNPKAQEQGLLTLKISQENTLIWGESGSGKENLLTTILYSSMIENTPYEINYYIIDCGSGFLKTFNKMPHVGEIAGIDDSNKIIDILSLIDKELRERKKLFEDYAGDYYNFIQNSGKTLPIITLVINNYEIFSETYSKIAEVIQTLYRDAPKYGVSFILSCITTNSVRSRTAQYFENKIALSLPDPNEYRTLVNAPKGLVPSRIFGRGLVAKDDTAYEFQTAYICDPKYVSKLIQATAMQFNKYYNIKAKKVDSIPEKVTIEAIANKIKGIDSIPIGYETNTKSVFNYNFTKNKINLILSRNIADNISFVRAVIKELLSIPNINIKVVDFLGIFDNIDKVTTYKDNFNRAFAIINNEIVAEKNSNTSNFYFIIGAGEMKSKLSEVGIRIADNLFMASNTLDNSFFVFADSLSSMKNLQVQEYWQTQVNKENGIWLGPDIGSQVLININDLDMEDRKIDFPELGFVINNGEHIVIKYVVDEEVKENEK